MFTTKSVLVGALTLVLIAGAGCNSDTAVGPEPAVTDGASLAIPTMWNASLKTALTASAKLRPADGRTVSGQIECYAEDRGILIIGTAWGMDPKKKYALYLHDKSTLLAPCAFNQGVPPLKVAFWSMRPDGSARIKVRLGDAKIGGFDRFAAATVEQMDDTGVTELVREACGPLVRTR